MFAKQSKDAYTRSQSAACFIQSIKDDLVGPGGIMDLFVREARLFKFGSGSGTNFSNIRGRGEKLSGGGVSSGLMSFLKIGAVGALTIDSFDLLGKCAAIKGWYSGTAADSEDALAFSQQSGVASMNEVFPLEEAQAAYDRMMSGKAKFRVVITMAG